MECQSAMPAADAASSVIDVLACRLEDGPACVSCDAGLLVFLGRVPVGCQSIAWSCDLR